MKTLALIAALPFLTPAQHDDLKQLTEKTQSRHVNARIDGLNVSEGFLGVNVYGSKTGGRYNFNGWSGRSAHVNFSGDLTSLFGSEISLNLWKSGDTIQASGWLGGKSVQFSLTKWNDSWSLNAPFGSSLSLYKSGSAYTLSGFVEEKDHEPGRLVAVIGAVVAMASQK